MAVKKEKLLALARQVIAILAADRITVYAAQSSFFCIISAVPFLSLPGGAFNPGQPERPARAVPSSRANAGVR